MADTTITVIQKAFIASPKWQILLSKNSLSEPNKPLYDLPGGPIIFSRSLRESLVSQVQEQTGLSITTISIPLNITTYLNIANRTEQIVRIIYLCLATGNLLPDRDLNWIESTHYEQYSFPDEGYQRAFKSYLSHSRLSSEEFLGSGILEHTTDFLRLQPQSPFLE
jgi:ADP-ribose pyrophosphatase YjhB (NUDIX family)